MSLSITLAAIWGILATVTALLPMRYQMGPGLLLLLAAPVLIVFLGVQHGLWPALAGLIGFLSMFRRPLGHLAGKVINRGKEKEGGS